MLSFRTTTLQYFFVPLCLILLASCASVTTNTNNTQAPTQTTLQLNNAAETNIRLGLYYLEQKNMQQAKTKLQLALQQSPENFLAYDAMGYFWESIQETSLAEKYYQQAIKIVPTNGATHNNYGTFLYRQKRCDLALIQFKKALQDNNYLNLAGVYKNAAQAALCLNDTKQAQKYFDKVALIAPQKKKED